MALSGMSSKEKTVVIVLAVLLALILIGAGILGAKLLAGDGGGKQAGGITPASDPVQDMSVPEPTATAIESALDVESDSSEPVAVAQAKSSGGVFSAGISDQPLNPSRQYRLEIVAEGGASIPIRGTWTQKAKTLSGKLELGLPKSFDAKTPFSMDLKPSVNNASSWSFSVTASPRDLLGNPPRLVIVIWDVTASQ